MQLYYADIFHIPLPPGHRFPGAKYRMLRETLLHQGIVAPWQLELSPQASRADLLRAHEPAYVEAFLTGALAAEAMRRIGLPWSEHLAARTLATMGGAVAAMRAALTQGFSAQLAGGTHHAHAGFGAGYCVFNDFAIAALTALAEGLAARIAIVDLDVHQGDGNAAILAGHPAVFVFSMHGEKNFPFRKVPSDLDIALADGTGDADYLRRLAEGLEAVLAFRPELVLYQAGVDGLQVELFRHPREQPGIELPLDPRVGTRGAGGEPGGQLVHRRVELVVGGHAVDQAPFERLPGTDPLAEHRHLRRTRDAYPLRNQQ